MVRQICAAAIESCSEATTPTSAHQPTLLEARRPDRRAQRATAATLVTAAPPARGCAAASTAAGVIAVRHRKSPGTHVRW